MLFFIYCLSVLCLAVSLHVLAELNFRRVGGSFYVARRGVR